MSGPRSGVPALSSCRPAPLQSVIGKSWPNGVTCRFVNQRLGMKEKEARTALEQIRGLAKANRVSFTRHALEEMQEADATERDVVEALCGARTCRPRSEEHTSELQSQS